MKTDAMMWESKKIAKRLMELADESIVDATHETFIHSDFEAQAELMIFELLQKAVSE
jgi:uncharacterized protein YfcZ (UPF0381/DUF406 family)